VWGGLINLNFTNPPGASDAETASIGERIRLQKRTAEQMIATDPSASVQAYRQSNCHVFFRVSELILVSWNQSGLNWTLGNKKSCFIQGTPWLFYTLKRAELLFM
jgi:hypothetical protein